MMKKRLIIGISGASGAIYGIRLLEALKNKDISIDVPFAIEKLEELSEQCVIQSKKVQLQKQSQEATDEYRKDSNANKIIDEYLKGRG